MSPANRPVANRPLVVERVDVRDAAIEARLRVRDARLTRTSAVPRLADSVLELLPGLLRHRCDCGSSHGIERELADTETPHLLEHIVLELMALSGSPRSLRGETEWDFAADGRGVYRVRIEYDDDLVALGALERGVQAVNALLSGDAPPDPRVLAEELLALRDR